MSNRWICGNQGRESLIQRHCAAAESLNSLYKREIIDLRKDWQGADDVTVATMDWVHWHNEGRLHSYCGDMPSKEYKEICYKALESGKLRDGSQI